MKTRQEALDFLAKTFDLEWEIDGLHEIHGPMIEDETAVIQLNVIKLLDAMISFSNK